MWVPSSLLNSSSPVFWPFFAATTSCGFNLAIVPPPNQGANNHSRPHLVFKVHSIVAHIERCTLVCTGDPRQLDADGKTTLSHLFPGRDNEFHKNRPLLLIALFSAWCLIVACWAQFVGRALHRNRPPIISTAFLTLAALLCLPWYLWPLSRLRPQLRVSLYGRPSSY